MKALIFDWHGVLDNVEFEGLTRLLASLAGRSLSEIQQELKGIERQYARGDISPKVFWDNVQDKLMVTDEQLALARSYINSADLNRSLWDIITNLSSTYKLAILSDCPQDKANYIRQNIDLSLFEVVSFSAEKHLLKSEPEFFQNVANDLGLDSNECLFIDDREKNMALPKELGFNIHLFDGDIAFLNGIEASIS